MDSIVMGIDPGASGSIVIAKRIDEDNRITLKELDVYRMPDNLKELAALFQKHGQRISTCYIEDVGFHRKGNSARSSVTFSRHVGNLEMALHFFPMTIQWIGPADWERTFGVPDNLHGLANKTLRKNWIKAKVSTLYPYRKWVLDESDAMGILHTASVMGIVKPPKKNKGKTKEKQKRD